VRPSSLQGRRRDLHQWIGSEHAASGPLVPSCFSVPIARLAGTRPVVSDLHGGTSDHTQSVFFAGRCLSIRCQRWQKSPVEAAVRRRTQTTRGNVLYLSYSISSSSNFQELEAEREQLVQRAREAVMKAREECESSILKERILREQLDNQVKILTMQVPLLTHTHTHRFFLPPPPPLLLPSLCTARGT
jgi:hypothetical protein